MEREKENENESGVIKDSPDSPEPFNKKPRLTLEDLQPQEKSKGISLFCKLVTGAEVNPHECLHDQYFPIKQIIHSTSFNSQ